MSKVLSAFIFGIALVGFVGTPSFAKDEEAKEVKLEGKITCAKCDLGIADKCATVIKVGEKVYFLDEKSAKDNHKAICTAAKDGTVTGKVTKDGDKLIVTVTKLEFKK
jgi:Family of unknown function (DUF6370)